MVDFRKRIAGKKAKKPTEPVELYNTLDRAHDKGPLRPAQIAVLKDWHDKLNETRDVIVKLHTGQGKTLIGLLMLQSRLNAGNGPALYLCPDNFLVAQTCDQARQFGITTCTADPELPADFSDGTQILVTSVQKLFNGLTKFGLHRSSAAVNTILMDDAHACADIIRESSRIRIPASETAYDLLQTLFADELEAQGVGTWADVQNGKRDALLQVPYWTWRSKEAEVARILSRHSNQKFVRFAWPLLKDMLSRCQCVISGAAIEIEPNVAPLDAFESYWKAEHRVFMSATVTDDAFLVKGLQLAPETIMNPLGDETETWSGERMILLPSLIHEELNREEIVASIGKPNPARRRGVVALVPSFARTKDWKDYGSIISDKDSVGDIVESLKKGEFENTVVLVNRYDGVDLPDNTCRILIFDGRPYSESLVDLYQELCRPNSDATLMRIIRTVEQGMGRSVRGERDYCVVVAIGTDLVRLLRDTTTRGYLSSQMAAQIDLGMEIAEMAKQEIENDDEPQSVFNGLVRQCINRDADWKEFYVEKMENVVPSGANEAVLRAYACELKAEQAFAAGDYVDASNLLQGLLNAGSVGADDKGWYLQEMARYQWLANRPESERLQVAAHKQNRMLLKPRSGITVARLEIVSQGRVERVGKWVGKFDNYSELDASVSDILECLTFGTKADRFEHALDELSRAIGFAGERPDKEWKEGPDNLWALDAEQYLLWECKNEVNVLRPEIHKSEAEQMNRSCAWFDKHYPKFDVKRLIVHPSNNVPTSAAFTHKVEAVRVAELKRLISSARAFFKSFESLNFKDLSPTHIQKLIDLHHLSVQNLMTNYSKKLRNLR
jgi:replicative superfamily II helicase